MKRTLRLSSFWLLLGAVACGPQTQTLLSPQDLGQTTEPSTPEPETSLPELDADPREPLIALGVSHLLSKQHLRNHPIDDTVSRAAFTAFMKSLDGGKMFLLQGQVDELGRYADRMDDQMRAGDLVLARKAEALLMQRHKVVAKAVADVLSKPFDFSVDESFETEADKRAFVATEAELTDRWRKLLKLQVLERVQQMEETLESLQKAKAKTDPEAETARQKALAEIPTTKDEQLSKARDELAKRLAARFTRLDDIDPLDPASRFMNAIATVYDPHTSYLAPAEKENFDIEMTGSLEGIGAVLAEKDHLIVVQEVVPGGASYRQGKLKAGDLILAVAQRGAEAVDVTDMPINKVVRMIRGPKGTVVSLTVKKSDDRIEVIHIKRDVIEIDAAYARGAVLELNGKPEIGYLFLPSFYGGSNDNGKKERNATDDVRALLREFQKRQLSGVVLDLRGNGGGLLGHARDITGLLIDSGPVVQTRYPGGRTEVLEDGEPGMAFNGEVVVMVDRASASASEILAGALQDYRRAVLVGTGATHGKGTVQALVNLDQLKNVPGGDPLGVVKLTIQQYFRVDGDSTQWRGVVPDLVLPDPVAHIEGGERTLDHSIPWSEIAPLSYQPWKGARWDVAQLADKSKKRRDAESVFAKIDARGSFLKAQRGDTLVPLQEDKWRARQAKVKNALDTVDPKLDEGKERLDVTLVDYAHRGTANDKNERLETWRKELTRDPWLEEATRLVLDMGN